MTSFLNYLLAILIILFLILYLITCKNFNYWKNKGVPHLKPLPLFGNFIRYITLQEYWGKVEKDLCEKFPNEPYFGAYYGTEPVLIVKDPDYINLVMTKDFYYFSGREVNKYTHKELFTQNLFFTYGDNWKILRQNMTTLFTTAKMRNMFYLIRKCAECFECLLEKECAKSSIVKIKSLTSRYTIDCVATCAFGVEANAMQEDVTSNPFCVIGHKTFKTTFFQGLKFVLRSMWPAIFYALGFKVFPEAVDKFFSHLLLGVFEKRGYKPSNRQDFVDLILNLKNQKYISGDCLKSMKGDNAKKLEVEVTDTLLTAQCTVLFAGGFETSASSLNFVMYELAKNKKAQERLIGEIDHYLQNNNNHINFNCLTDLPYLEACLEEALRLYPILGVLTREVEEDYTFPTGLKVEKGLRIHIPVYAIHKNEEFFPDPEAYRPERFMPEEKNSLTTHTSLSFGKGPRFCIGIRFAKMQLFSAIITLFKKYRIELADDLINKKMGFNPKAIVTSFKEDIKIKLIARPQTE